MMDLCKHTTLTILLLALLEPTLSQFPRRCTDDYSLRLRECCPVGADGTKCGQSSNRGNCTDIRLHLPELSIDETFRLLLDDRAWWPTAFYDKACQCKNNFDGVDCSKCKPGYEGDKCKKTSQPKTRKNIKSLSSKDLQKYVDIVNRSKYVNSEEYVILTTSYKKLVENSNITNITVFKNISIYNLYVWMHYYVTKNPYRFPDTYLHMLNNNNKPKTNGQRKNLAKNWLLKRPNLTDREIDYAHEGPSFLPWHRYLMLKWETDIRDYVANDPDFALYYWDWRDKTTCDVCVDTIAGGRHPKIDYLLSEGSPFSQWKITCTKELDYLKKDMQCSGKDEGVLRRNHGRFNPRKISGLPTKKEVEDIYNLGTSFDSPDYNVNSNFSFRNLLEGFGNPITGMRDNSMSYLHNAVHIYMNGTMSDVDKSANDPVFILHHTFIDSLFEKWLRNSTLNHTFEAELGPRMGHRPQDYMVPFFPLVTIQDGFTQGCDLGYTYDYLDSTGLTGLEIGLIVSACVLAIVLVALSIYCCKCKPKMNSYEQGNEVK